MGYATLPGMDLGTLLDIANEDWSRRFVRIRAVLALGFLAALAFRAPFAIHALDALVKARTHELLQEMDKVLPPTPHPKG